MTVHLIENQNIGEDIERYDSETRHYSDITVLTPLCFLSKEDAQWFMDRHYSTEAKEQRKIVGFITADVAPNLGILAESLQEMCMYGASQSDIIQFFADNFVLKSEQERNVSK